MRDVLKDRHWFDERIRYQEGAIQKFASVAAEPEGNAEFLPEFVLQRSSKHLHLLMLEYSRGDRVDVLKRHLYPLLDAWEEAERLGAAVWSPEVQRQRRSWAGNISFYNRCFWLVGLALALELEDGPWQRLLKLVGNEGQDALLDRVIATRQPGRPVGEALCHPHPYARLLAVLDGPHDRQPALLRDFVTHWYTELDRPPRKGLSRLTNLDERPDWHGNHEGVSSYFGYWCVEAVAVVKAFGIDDSLCLGHPHYPGDLLRPQGPSTHLAGEAPQIHAMPDPKPGLLQRLRRAF